MDCESNDIIKLDVGGSYYTTARATLLSEPDTMLSAMFSGNFALKKDSKGRIFIDRDGDAFQYILNYLRDKVLLVPPAQEPYYLLRLYIEARYFSITNLQSLIEKKLGKDFIEKRLQDLSVFPAVHTPTKSPLALFFQGCSITLPMDQLPAAGQPYTIECWVLPIVHRVNGIVGWGNWGAFAECNALRLGEGTIINYWWGLDLTCTCESLINSWHHICVTHDPTTHKSTMYLDGTPIGEQNRPTQYSAKSNAKIGVTNDHEFFIGWIKDVRIWNVCRTGKQIKKNMKKLHAIEDGLKIYVPLDKIDNGAVLEVITKTPLKIVGSYSVKEPHEDY